MYMHTRVAYMHTPVIDFPVEKPNNKPPFYPPPSAPPPPMHSSYLWIANSRVIDAYIGKFAEIIWFSQNSAFIFKIIFVPVSWIVPYMYIFLINVSFF